MNSEKHGRVPSNDAGQHAPNAYEQLGLELAEAAARLWRESDGNARSYREPVVATLKLDLDPDILRMIQSCLDARASGRDILLIDDPDLIASIKELVGHETSPSVGAPSGAGVGTFEHTGGDDAGVPGVKPGTPSVNIHISDLPDEVEARIDALTRRTILANLRGPKKDLR